MHSAFTRGHFAACLAVLLAAGRNVGKVRVFGEYHNHFARNWLTGVPAEISEPFWAL